VQVLVADDDVVFRLFLVRSLERWGYEVCACADGDAALEALRGEAGPKLALLDWEMPGKNGDEVCRAVRQWTTQRYPYLILLTAKDRHDGAAPGLESGADDYLNKPFDPPELKARLLAGRRILDLQDQLITAREALRVQAFQDGLTGIWNRRAIMEELERELNRAERDGSPVSVVMVDLDHFKQINDRHGHQAGDEVLREAARRMTHAKRPYDAIGRYGGEEFLLVLPGCDENGGALVAERMRKRVAARPIEHGDRQIAVTASLGVAAYPSSEALDMASLLGAADRALYRAKSRGRDRVESAATLRCTSSSSSD
jgi:two-component system, cell cycle response regulator